MLQGLRFELRHAHIGRFPGLAVLAHGDGLEFNAEPGEVGAGQAAGIGAQRQFQQTPGPALGMGHHGGRLAPGLDGQLLQGHAGQPSGVA